MNVSKNLTWPMVASTNLKSSKPQLATPDPEAERMDAIQFSSIIDNVLGPTQTAYDAIWNAQDKQAFAEKVLLILYTKPSQPSGREYDAELVRLVGRLVKTLAADNQSKAAPTNVPRTLSGKDQADRKGPSSLTSAEDRQSQRHDSDRMDTTEDGADDGHVSSVVGQASPTTAALNEPLLVAESSAKKGTGESTSDLSNTIEDLELFTEKDGEPALEKPKDRSKDAEDLKLFIEQDEQPAPEKPKDTDEDSSASEEVLQVVHHPRLVENLKKHLRNSHSLLIHPTEKGSSAQFQVLRQAIASYFVDSMGCNPDSLKASELKIVKIIAKCFEVNTFNSVMKLGRDLIMQQRLKTNADTITQNDLRLQTASRAFAEAIRKFDGMQIQQGIDKNGRHLRVNIAYMELYTRCREALQEMDQQIKNNSNWKSHGQWLTSNLEAAQLKDVFGLAKLQPFTRVSALRILQFYQRQRAMNLDENDYLRWSRDLDDHLSRGSRINGICSFDRGLCGLLPHNIAELMTTEIEVKRTRGKKGTPGFQDITLDIFHDVFQAIQDRGIKIKQVLRALWTYLLVKVVDGKPIDEDDYRKLQRLITDFQWDAIPDDLADS